jgi:outer membrane protein OmpA-like peptidoglycan-associated protein
LGRVPLRVILQALNSLGAGDRNYIVTAIGFQFGIPFGKRSSVAAAETPIRVTSAAPMREPRQLRILLDPKKVFFGTNSSKIRAEVRRALRDIGEYLAENPAEWGSLKVSGHADQRGKAEYNLRLSKRRSEAVLNVLTNAGVADSKVDLEFHGESQPVDPENNPRAWAENRRVELVFEGVTDPEALKSKIEELSRYQASGENS